MSTFEPETRPALWSRRLGLFAVTVALVGLLVQRSGRVDVFSGLAPLLSAGILAGVAIFLGLAGFLLIWMRGSRGAGAAVVGLLAGSAVLAPPAIFVALHSSLPRLSDVSTDTAQPPHYAPAGEEHGGSALAGGGIDADVQTAAYPEIAPLQTSASPEEAAGIVLEVFQKRGWRIVEATGKSAPGRQLQAVASTPVLHLLQDVVVRTEPASNGTRVDVRARMQASLRDFGASARLVNKLLLDLTAALP